MTAAAIKQNIDPQVASQNIARSFPSQEAQARWFTESSILWVDDDPKKNTLLINAFQDLGIRVFLATSTEQAQALIRQTRFEMVISDATRNGDSMQGEELVRWIRSQPNPPPTIIYAMNWAKANSARAAEVGALSITNDPSEVYHLVLRIIQRVAPSGIALPWASVSGGGIPAPSGATGAITGSSALSR